MSDPNPAILRLACIASTHARSIASSEEAATLYDDIADALSPSFPNAVEVARSTASLLREGERHKQQLSELLDSLLSGQLPLSLDETNPGQDGQHGHNGK